MIELIGIPPTASQVLYLIKDTHAVQIMRRLFCSVITVLFQLNNFKRETKDAHLNEPHVIIFIRFIFRCFLGSRKEKCVFISKESLSFHTRETIAGFKRSLREEY